MATILSEFKGLPVEDLIAGPLTASCDAQVRLANATADFIKVIGFQPPTQAQLQADPDAVGAPRTVSFSFTRPTPPVAANPTTTPPTPAQPAGTAVPDTLAALPASYGDVPKLGPPLPGDLGRPILDRQRQLAGTAMVSGSDAATQAAAERERALAARKAARESALLVSLARGDTAPGTQAAPAVAASDPARRAPGTPELDPANDGNARQHKVGFVAAQDPQGAVNPHALTPPPSPYVLSAGSVVAASLLTGLRSDLPGLVTAQVTERVYDSPTGRTLLIPQGARLIGRYDSVVAFGQKRALIVWQRLIMPDGSSLVIDDAPATDPSGYAGLEDKVDRHTWQLIEGAALSTLLGVGSELALNGDGDLVEAIRRSSQDNVARAGDRITTRTLAVQPTITVRPGTPVRLVVNKDLVLAPWADEGR